MDELTDFSIQQAVESISSFGFNVIVNRDGDQIAIHGGRELIEPGAVVVRNVDMFIILSDGSGWVVQVIHYQLVYRVPAATLREAFETFKRLFIDTASAIADTVTWLRQELSGLPVQVLVSQWLTGGKSPATASINLAEASYVSFFIYIHGAMYFLSAKIFLKHNMIELESLGQSDSRDWIIQRIKGLLDRLFRNESTA